MLRADLVIVDLSRARSYPDTGETSGERSCWGGSREEKIGYGVGIITALS